MVSDTPVQVSTIIVTHNSAGPLTECLTALKKSASGVTVELIVVDNASSDDSVDLVGSLWPEARVLRNDRNLGFGAAANLGAKEAVGRYLFLVNPDVTVDPGAIETLLATMKVHPKPGLVSGRLCFPDGSFQATCRRIPTPSNIVFSRGAMTSRIGGRSKQPSHYTLPDYESTTEVETVSGTMAMIERGVFEKFGGFDERFFMYMEDTELCVRLHQSGYSNLFVPKAGGVHLWGRGSGGGRVTRLWHHHMSVWRYFLKHFPNGFSVVALPFLLLLNFMLRLPVPDRTEHAQ